MLRRRPLARRALATAVALAALAGCGGSSSGPPSQAQYIAKVNAICATEQQQLEAISASSTTLPAKTVEATQLREQVIAKIAAVKSPKAGEAISPEWLQVRRQALATAKRISALGFGTRAARPATLEYLQLSNKALRLARAYGLSECSRYASV